MGESDTKLRHIGLTAARRAVHRSQRTGYISDGHERQALKVGSFVFVPAGQPHRFEDFSADFAVRGVFYGLEKGRRA